MRKAPFTEYQIIAVLKFTEADRNLKVFCRDAGIYEASKFIAK